MTIENSTRADDRSRTALVHGGSAPWVASPEAGVERRLLERIGGEVALATPIVRYVPGSRFAEHMHGLGEEFLVLEGVFSDQQGDYPVGTYVRNPPGSRHAPFSVGGCVIFVKLRQMHPAETRAVRCFEAGRAWQFTGSLGRLRALLFDTGGVVVTLQRLAAGAELPIGGEGGAQEVFVVEGEAVLEDGAPEAMARWSWLRRPQGGAARIVSPAGALLWTKAGHLGPVGTDTVKDL